MPFYVYSGGNLEHKHENKQLLKIITPVREHFRDSKKYCYAFINPKFYNSDKLKQYDLVFFEKNCISIIEMKSMNGSIYGTLIDDHGKSKDLYIKKEDNNINLNWDQMCHQRSYLRSYMGRDFKKNRRMDKDTHFRIDQYWVFNDPTDTDNLNIDDWKIEKWLTITTIANFYDSFFGAKKNQPFTLSEDNIRFLAKAKFKLKERNINKIFTPLVPAIKKLSNDLIEFSDQNLDESFELLKDEFRSKLTDREYEFLVDFRINIFKYFEDIDKRNQFRAIIKKINIPYSENKIYKILENQLVKLMISLNNDILKSFSSVDHYHSSKGLKNTLGAYGEYIDSLNNIRNLIDLKHSIKDDFNMPEYLPDENKEIFKNMVILKIIMNEIQI